MDILNDFGAWAWARHHNILSWYIRPLFLIPYIWFAWRRSGWGIAATLVALATSMFWFPAPAAPDPQVEGFLAMERDYLLGAWTPWKVIFTLLVPLSMGALAVAFWRRSLAWGLALINAIALAKILWSFAYGEQAGGMAVLLPALLGLAVTNAAVLLIWRWSRRRAPLVEDGL